MLSLFLRRQPYAAGRSDAAITGFAAAGARRLVGGLGRPVCRHATRNEMSNAGSYSIGACAATYTGWQQ